jgi:hypothetical protein
MRIVHFLIDSSSRNKNIFVIFFISKMFSDETERWIYNSPEVKVKLYWRNNLLALLQFFLAPKNLAVLSYVELLLLVGL